MTIMNSYFIEAIENYILNGALRIKKTRKVDKVI